MQTRKRNRKNKTVGAIWDLSYSTQIELDWLNYLKGFQSKGFALNFVQLAGFDYLLVWILIFWDNRSTQQFLTFNLWCFSVKSFDGAFTSESYNSWLITRRSKNDEKIYWFKVKLTFFVVRCFLVLNNFVGRSDRFKFWFGWQPSSFSW